MTYSSCAGNIGMRFISDVENHIQYIVVEGTGCRVVEIGISDISVDCGISARQHIAVSHSAGENDSMGILENGKVAKRDICKVKFLVGLNIAGIYYNGVPILQLQIQTVDLTIVGIVIKGASFDIAPFVYSFADILDGVGLCFFCLCGQSVATGKQWSLHRYCCSSSSCHC